MRFALPLLLIAAAAPAAAQRLGYEDVLHPAPRLGYEPVEIAAPPPEAAAPEAEADDEGPVHEAYLDRMEWRGQPGANGYSWDVAGMIGGPRNRLWLSSAGDGTLGGLDYVEVQALFSRAISESGLELQAGIRRDFVPRPRRSYLALGVQGNVTEPLYVGAFGFLSRQGEFTARLFALYDIALAERLILQPAIEAEIAGADVEALGIGRGPVYVETGLRLRYRIHEAFAPYVGVNWERLLGRTARQSRAAGDEVGTLSLVAGLRSYF
jgi:copper resistance protein B